MKFNSFLFLGILLAISSSCKKDIETRISISGQISDYETGIPLADVLVEILENGPATITDEKGEFQFDNSEIHAFALIEPDTRNNYGIKISLESYKTMELNIDSEESKIIELVPENYPGYVYHTPLKLDDGLLVGSINETGIDTVFIFGLLDKLVRGDYTEVHSVLIYHKDKLILEEYFRGNNDTIQFENNITRDRSPDSIQWTRKDEHYIASVNKAVTSSIVGIALNQYGKSVSDKISEYLPEYSSYFSDENKANLTIEHCLTMTLGFKWDEWNFTDLSTLWKSDDFTKFLLERNNYGVGTNWVYNSASPNLLLNCMDKLVEGSIRNWADENFFSPLGITDYKWQSQPGGLPEGAARMYLRPRDMLKIGVTYLNEGMWNGSQLIPANWVNSCFDVQFEGFAGDYSYFFWKRKINDIEYLSAEGDGGNYINIFPEQDLVIVFTQGNYLQYNLYNFQTIRMMRDYILPAVE